LRLVVVVVHPVMVAVAVVQAVTNITQRWQ
jgi:hypothetical protein